MAETTSEIVSTDKAAPSPKKGKATKAKKPRTVPSHPKTSDMVNAAITNLKERGGSSLQAIKKYVAATYKVDVEKLSPFIKKYLKSAVTSGALVQTKGKGASGSFKLSGGKSEKRAEGKKTKKASPKKAAKASPAKKSKPSAAVKTAKPKKKSAVKPAAAATKKASAGKKKVTPSAAKPKKAAKSPKAEKKAKVQKKPKSPKPKKAVKKASGKK